MRSHSVIAQWQERKLPSRHEEYELGSILYEAKEQSFTFVNKYKLWRLLGKGSGAAGTWKSLLDHWQEIDKQNKRSELYVFDINGTYLITTQKSEKVQQWAGEI